MISPTFAVQDIPFSYAGSWFGISPVVAEKTVAEHLHLVSHQTGLHAVLRLVPVRGGATVDTAITATPAALSWSHAAGRIDLAYETPDTVRLRGHGVGMSIHAAHPTLTPFSGTYFYRDPVDGAYVFTDYGTGRRYRITVLTGTATATGEEALGTAERGVTLDADTPWELAVEEYETARAPYRDRRTFDELARA